MTGESFSGGLNNLSPDRLKPEADTELLELAAIALAAVGYLTTMEGVDRSQILFAENAWSAIAIGAASTVEGLIAMEPSLSLSLLSRLKERTIPDLRRDAYVVLLTAQPAEAQQSEALFGMTYNLRHVRRVVRTGVEPTTFGLARALRPVLPLLVRPNAENLVDPLEALEVRLKEDGIDAELIESSIRKFRAADYTHTTVHADAGFEEMDEDDA
jgi:hypothetical protein